MWMRFIMSALLLACFPAGAGEVPAESLGAGYVNPGYEDKPGWFVNSFLDIREDVAEAAADGKQVILYFYQDGCPYCKKLLETNFTLREIVEKTRSRYHVIAINMWGDREVTDFNGELTTEKSFASGLRIMFTPTMLFLDDRGQVVLRVNGYYPPRKFDAALDYAAQYTGRSPGFAEFYAGLESGSPGGRLHTDPGYLQPPYRLAARESEKPLLVLFEQKDCPPCDELHLDILQRPESRELLDRFDVALLDIHSREMLQRADRIESSAADWARDLEIQYVPALVFFDDRGREVFRAEAWFRSFHIQSVLDYVASGAYLEQPDFQRFIAARADALEAQGIHVDLMD